MKKNLKNENEARDTTGGFTLIELIVSVSIFVIMTTIVAAKFGTFSQSSNLTNAIYDIALTIRSSQTFGLNVKSSGSNGTPTNDFSHAYGTHFATSSSERTKFRLFADLLNDDGLRTDGSEDVTISTLKKGVYISKIETTCTGAGMNSPTIVPVVDITFRRPDPDAIIKATLIDGTVVGPCQFARITIKAATSTRAVDVRNTGQIAVE